MRVRCNTTEAKVPQQSGSLEAQKRTRGGQKGRETEVNSSMPASRKQKFPPRNTEFPLLNAKAGSGKFEKRMQRYAQSNK